MTVYRIETDRLVIRCWEPKDAPLLKEAIDVSIDHLLPWMPWAVAEPQTLEEKVELLRTFRGKFDLGQDYILGIFNRDETEVLGGTGFHLRRGDNEREIGYWVRADRANQGIITEATSALVKVGFEVDRLHRLEIRCDPENGASEAIPRKLGFRLEATFRKHMTPGHDEPQDVMIWSMLNEEYHNTPSATIAVKAYDVLGNRVDED
ncbi:MAG: GNAT family N-acetyltransferase [Ignavibacteriae bacterium]|nr:GNAT family N-acetyltransferase [Ignavibacteriota bacterium]MCB9216759.1 GNAT family N-acetyltransferase [Ignavibacteria bacterium]